jgi:diguanylate cyclase (GGDEF)-like protein
MTRFRYYCIHNISIFIYVISMFFHLYNITALWECTAAHGSFIPRLIPLAGINIVFFLMNLSFVGTYIKRNKLVVYTVYAVSTAVYCTAYIFITRTDPLLESIMIAQIAMTYMLTNNSKVPRHYYRIMNTLFVFVIILIEFASSFYCKSPYVLENQCTHLYQLSFGCTILTSLLCILVAAGYSSFILYRTRLQEERAEASTNYLANHDPLTHLMNRRRISDILAACEKKRQMEGINYAFCIFDIDNFKRINDMYGHDCGDFILHELTHRIRLALPEKIKIGRWGGEEFLIIYPSYTENTIFELDAVRASISAVPYIYNGEPIIVTATFGISSSRNLPTPDAVLTDADRRLLEGKTNGKNRLVVSELF